MLVYSSGSLGILGYTDSNFQGDIDSCKISYEENLVDLFTKPLSKREFEKLVNCVGFKRVPSLL